MAGKGGKTPGAGRKPGVPNKVTTEIKSIAQQWGPDAIKALAELAGLVADKPQAIAQSEQARIAALGMIMDRAYGKPSQTIAGDAENPFRLVGKIEVTVVDPNPKG
jgi:hypothetical protein